MNLYRTGTHRVRPDNTHTRIQVPALPHPGRPRHAAEPSRIAELLHRTLPLRITPTRSR